MANRTAMQIQAGTRLGRYEVRSLLGEGGMGEVYLAWDSELERQVALKVLPADLASDQQRMRRFIQEAQAASALNHPNILSIYDVGQAESFRFIVMEYVEGETLRQRLSSGRLGLREALDVASQVASALVEAHRAGIVHRDIKPENVMLRRGGIVKILDFGIAKLAEQRQRVASDTQAPTRALVNTGPGTVMGTVSYMSPEQARGLEVDERTDIWSLGCVLYEMVSGRLPFTGATATDVLATILHREPPSLLLHRPDVPDELERIVEKALTKDREERHQTAKDLALDLKRLRQRLEIESELERSVTPERSAEERRAATGSGMITGTHPAAATQTGGAGDIHTTASSAEYLVHEIRQHKRGAALVSGALLLAIVGLGYFFYFAGGGKAPINSLAVLPFVNATSDPDAEYLSDGITESLINHLSQLPQLKVIARSSAFKYKGKEVDIQEAAKALGVEAVVMGRIVGRGDSLSISVEMVNIRDGSQMWGEKYSRKASDVQAVQDEIARAISDKLRLRLTGSQEQQLTKRATDNPQAYQLYLNGMFQTRKGGIEGMRKSLDFYNQAIALDPDFALPYAGVADAYRALASNSAIDPKEAAVKVKAAVQKALALDDTMAEAHVVLAALKQDEWDWAGAESEFKRAIELNPNLAQTHFRYSQYLADVGRFTEALTEVKRAQELDPLRIALRGQEGTILYFARRYDEAVEKLRQSIDLEPNDGINHVFLGYIYDARGQYAEALNEYRKCASLEGDSTSLDIFMGHAYAKSGKRGEAQSILARLKSTKEYVSPAELAVLYVGLGDKEAAFEALERAYAAHDLQLQYLNVEPDYDHLRADPRFVDLVRRVGLPQ
jgi:serine/threonine protein kinase/tetratricopeptide (TPR) repeat protein